MQSSFSAIAHASKDHDVLCKFRPLHYQAPFVDVSLLANGPNTIILVVNRRVQVKVFFISEKDLREFHWQATDKFLTEIMKFLLDGLRDDLSWNESKGRQLKVTFHNSLNG